MFGFRQWLEAEEIRPKVLWITGMNSTGLGPKKLKELGYDVVHAPSITNWPTAILGRLKRYDAFKKIGNIANQWGSQHILKNLHQVRDLAADFEPDIVVGTSQGGAIALRMSHRYPDAKFVLVAPAWKIFNVKSFRLPPDTIIIHSKDDVKVPIEDSVELSQITGAELKVVSGSHSVAFEVILDAIRRQSKRVSLMPRSLV